MLLVRQTFQAKYGRGDELVQLFREFHQNAAVPNRETARILTDNSKIVPLRIGFFLGGDVSIGEDAVGYALAAWMIVIMAFAMTLYWVARKRAERWQS